MTGIPTATRDAAVALLLLAALAMTSANVQAARGPALISRTAQDAAASGPSGEASLSGDGTRLAFSSEAVDLVSGDSNGVVDVFLFDSSAGTLRRVSITAAGGEASKRSLMPALSADGRWLAYRADGPMTADPAPLGGLYLLDLTTGSLRLILADTDNGRGRSDFPAISADGGVVAFESTVSLTATTAEPLSAVLVWHAATGALERVSPPDADAPARDVAVSGDGRHIAFVSTATNIGPATSGKRQVYVVNTESGSMELASITSADQPANGDSGEPTLSGDGQWLAFTSLATDLVPKDVNGVTDIFVRDRATSSTRAVTDVLPGNDVYHPGDSSDPMLSTDGKAMTFASKMYTLTPGDSNRQSDVYHLRLDGGPLQRISLRQDGAESSRPSWSPALSADGNAVAFTSTGDLAPEDKNDLADVYQWGAGATDHATVTPPHGPSATPVHDPSGTPPPHPTATPPHDPSATAPPHHPTATALHDPSATPPPHHPTATSQHDPSATAPPQHPTATADPHGTAVLDRSTGAPVFLPWLLRAAASSGQSP